MAIPSIGELLGGKSCALDVRAVLEGGTRVNIKVQLQDKRNGTAGAKLTAPRRKARKEKR